MEPLEPARPIPQGPTTPRVSLEPAGAAGSNDAPGSPFTPVLAKVDFPKFECGPVLPLLFLSLSALCPWGENPVHPPFQILIILFITPKPRGVSRVCQIYLWLWARFPYRAEPNMYSSIVVLLLLLPFPLLFFLPRSLSHFLK